MRECGYGPLGSEAALLLTVLAAVLANLRDGSAVTARWLFCTVFVAGSSVTVGREAA